MQTTSYRMRLAEDATVVVWFATQRDLVVSYSIVLLRVYDNAHGHNEMHRTRSAAANRPQKRSHQRATSAWRCHSTR